MSSLTEEMAKTEVEGADDPLAKTLADLSKNLSSDAEKVGGGGGILLSVEVRVRLWDRARFCRLTRKL